MLSNHLGYPINYWGFKTKFFYEIRMGHRMIPKIKKGAEVELAQIIKRIGSTVRLEDCADVPEQQYITEYFNLNTLQKRAIKGLQEPVQITRWTKIHQIMGGTLKGDEYNEDQFFGSDKLERLKELITENPKSIVVCRYKNEIEYLKNELRESIPIHIITGDVKNRDEIIQDCRRRDRYCLLVIAQCSEGWELPECPLMIFYSYDFSLKNYVQMCGRILRINALKKNVYLSLVVRDSIDEDVYKCLQNKMDFQIEIYKNNYE
jgi:superfamily II DNA or RNA helicase